MFWHIFCHVVDNFGDVGVCWRLARQLAEEHGQRVTLWIDDLGSFARLTPPAPVGRGGPRLPAGLTVEAWREPVPHPEGVNVVIEAFGCRLPEAYVAAMAARPKPPVWINLEHLSAESWVTGCHGLHSPQPGLPLVKHFFFPGFTPGTGGLIRERSLERKRREFLRGGQAPAEFWRSLGIDTPEGGSLVVSLFCYPENPVAELFEAWAAGPRPITCLLPEGVAEEARARFLGPSHRLSACAERGGLRVCRVPFQDQGGYDRLLWACDWNFVRGEDSFVRAQWAARPFVWAPYRQHDGAHFAKLDAFLDLYARELPPPAAAALRRFSRAWSGELDALGDAWEALIAERGSLAARAPGWAAGLSAQADLASGLVAFCAARV